MTTDRNAHIGVAIIGCGDMGNAHAVAWKSRADASVVACYDADRARAAALAELVGARVADSYADAIGDDTVQLVSVCVPVSAHPQITIHAAGAGRGVICEKPIALSLAEADQMITECRQQEVPLVISYQYRAMPAQQRWKHLIDKGELGGPLMFRYEELRGVRPKLAMHRRDGNGGPMIDMLGHFVDLVRFHTGEEPLRVWARGHCFGKAKPQLATVTDPALDAAEILVEYGGGHIASILVNWGLPSGHRGHSRQIISGPIAIGRTDGDKLVVQHAGREVPYPLPSPPQPNATAARIDDLVTAWRISKRPEVAGEDGRIALQVGLAAIQSIETGAVVAL